MTDGDLYRIKWGASIISAVLFIWLIIHVATYREITPYTVIGLGWDTQIDVEQYQTVHEGAWHVPDGGRETDHYRKQRGTERYQSGTRTVFHSGSCTGTGKNRRCTASTTSIEPVYSYRPVYATWYEYDIDKWVNIQPLQASGNQIINRAANKQDHYWYMPDTTDGDYKDIANIGNKRLGLRRTHFFVILNSNDPKKPNQQSIDLPESDWQTYEMNARYKITFGWFGNIIKISR